MNIIAEPGSISQEPISQSQPHSTLNRYVYPVFNHPVTRLAYMTVVEMVKIAAAKVFLEYAANWLLISRNMPAQVVWLVAVAAPVVEEIIFRGVVQRGIAFIQNVINYSKKREISSAELETQRMYRVQITASLFAAAHLMNAHKSVSAKLFQFSWCYIGGVSYGYLSERYRTIAVSILTHGINNIAALCLIAYPNAYIQTVCTLVLIINPLASYLLGTQSLEKMRAKLALFIPVQQPHQQQIPSQQLINSAA